MKKNIKGFTLIELLAVIIIIAIIALISTPIVLRIIDNSKKEALMSSINEILKAGEIYRTTKLSDRSEECVYFNFSNASIVDTEILYTDDFSDTNLNPQLNYESDPLIKQEIINKYKEHVTLIPISDLKLKGSIPKSGYMRVCKNEAPFAFIEGNRKLASGTYNSTIAIGSLSNPDHTAPLWSTDTGISTIASRTTIRAIANAYETNGKIKDYHYYIKKASDSEYTDVTTSESNTYLFSDLLRNTEYDIKIDVTNDNNLFSSKTIRVKTLSLDEVSIKTSTNDWSEKKVITLTSAEGTKISYKVTGTVEENIEIDNTNLSESNVVTLTYTSKGTVFAQTVSENIMTDGVYHQIDKIDTTAPTIVTKVNGTTKSSATIYAMCVDSESGIKKIGFSKDNKQTFENHANDNWNENINDYSELSTFASGTTFISLNNSPYTFYSKCTNGSNLSIVKSAIDPITGSDIINLPGYQDIIITPVDGTINDVWQATKTYEVTFPYFVDDKVSNYFSIMFADATLLEGEGSNLSSGSNLVANKEYKITSKTIKIKFAELGDENVVVLRTRFVDEETYEEKVHAPFSIGKIDNVKPVVKANILLLEEGLNAWYTSGYIFPSIDTKGRSDIETIYKKVCYDAPCTTITSANMDKIVSVDEVSNVSADSKEQYVCYKAISGAGKESDISCTRGLYVDSEKPTLPILNGSTNSWQKIPITVDLATPSTAASGIEYYEYYESTSTTAPTDSTPATGTTTGTYTETKEGTYYIYYRAVSKAGLKSDWTNAQVSKYDTATPSCTLAITSGTLGDNGWYKSNVTVTMTTSSASSSGLSYGFTNTYDNSVDAGNIGNATTTLSANTAGTNVIGYVKTGAGNTSTCSTTVKIEKSITPPASSSTSGTINSVTAVFSSGSATSGITGTSCQYGTSATASLITTAADLSGSNCTKGSLSYSSGNISYYFKKCITSAAGNSNCEVSTAATQTGYCNSTASYCGTYGVCSTSCGGGTQTADKVYYSSALGTGYTCSTQANGCSQVCNTEPCISYIVKDGILQNGYTTGWSDGEGTVCQTKALSQNYSITFGSNTYATLNIGINCTNTTVRTGVYINNSTFDLSKYSKLVFTFAKNSDGYGANYHLMFTETGKWPTGNAGSYTISAGNIQETAYCPNSTWCTKELDLSSWNQTAAYFEILNKNISTTTGGIRFYFKDIYLTN